MLTTRTPPGLETPVRNRYFYGKLLDVEQFELETRYLNAKRWLLNRLVTGYGVVCGLDVLPGDEPNELWIGPGVAIDKLGPRAHQSGQDRSGRHPRAVPAAGA